MYSSRSDHRSAQATTTAPAATQGSQTITQTDNNESAPPGTLRLRAEPSESRHIQWAEDVIDNEGMGKKSSKVCCIYHKPHEPGDSDSDSDSSDSDSDSEPDLSRARRAGDSRGRKAHDHKKYCQDASPDAKDRKPSPNAYERQPKPKNRKEG